MAAFCFVHCNRIAYSSICAYVFCGSIYVFLSMEEKYIYFIGGSALLRVSFKTVYRHNSQYNYYDWRRIHGFFLYR